MATNTYVALATQTLTTSAASVLFSSISGAYTDLQIVINANNTTNGSNCKIQFNGDGGVGSLYSTTWLEGTGSASSGRESGATSSFIYYNANASTYPWSTANVSIQNYSNATTYKTSITRFGNQAQTGAYVGLWRNTNAITSITLNAITQNFQSGSTFSLYGIAASGVTPAAKATGGAIYADDLYYYHVFGSTGTFTPLSSLSADVLVVAGGGGAGANGSGGGGAGGLRLLASQSLTATGYTCTVGGGGANVYLTTGASGGNSSFSSISATGGGGGGGAGNGSANTGGSGGSGGGTHRTGTAGTGNAGSYSPVEGFAGATGASGGGSNGGGGGGAGAAGTAGTSSNGGAGGLGTSTYNSIPFSTWLTATGLGISDALAGGGGGGGSTTGGTGTSGGGNGGVENGNGTNGTASTGGGGGGGGQVNPTAATGGNGGSGVVIVRYLKA